MRCLYTIGYSTNAFDAFCARLKAHGIDAVCDVRSSPYSGYAPDYSRERLKELLSAQGIRYVFLGEELGARPKDLACYRNGIARHDLIAAHPAFARGLDRLARGVEDYVPALMCAERDPIDCHRAVLVARHFARRSAAEIRHILVDGNSERHADFEQRLLARHGRAPIALFGAADPNVGLNLEAAYDAQSRKIEFAEKADSAPAAVAN